MGAGEQNSSGRADRVCRIPGHGHKPADDSIRPASPTTSCADTLTSDPDKPNASSNPLRDDKYAGSQSATPRKCSPFIKGPDLAMLGKLCSVGSFRSFCWRSGRIPNVRYSFSESSRLRCWPQNVSHIVADVRRGRPGPTPVPAEALLVEMRLARRRGRPAGPGTTSHPSAELFTQYIAGLRQRGPLHARVFG